MIARFATLFFACILFSTILFAQSGLSSPATRDSADLTSRQLDLSGTYTQVYSDSACGLNYVQCTRRLGQRFTPVGYSQPDTFTVSGIPACAVIEKAFLWTEVLGYGQIPVTINITNPISTTISYPLSLISTGVDVCWNMGATQTYKADVTGIVTGDGQYVMSGFPVSEDTFSYDTEGATLFIIYSDASAGTTGHLIIDEGGFTSRGYDSLTYNVGGFATCGPSQNARAFAIVGDMQLEPFMVRFNGGPVVNPAVDWWNYVEGNITLSVGQSSCSIYTREVNDCYTPVVYGVYYQTGCTQCAVPLSLSCSITPASCHNNGNATVSASGGTAPYQITWYTSPAQTGPFIDSLASGPYRVVITDNNGLCRDTIITIPDASLHVTFTNTALSCLNGSSTATVTNGTGPYSYMWDNNPLLTSSTITATSPGLHLLTVTDANGACADTSTVISTTSPTITTSATTTYCNAPTGTATANVTGGTPPYTYSWNTSPVQTTQTATALTDTVYTVVITDANGCTASRTVTVYEIFPAPQFVTVRDTICTDSTTLCHGKAWVTGFTNGIGPYYIQWNTNPPVINDSVFNLCPGPGSVTFLDSTTGCGHTHWFYPLSPVQPFSFTSQVIRHVTCGINDSSRVTGWTANAVQPVSFHWSSNPPQTTNPATGMGAGTYSVTMTDARGCYRTNQITINNNNPLNLTRTITPVKYCGNVLIDSGTVATVPSGWSPPYSILWNTTPPQTSFTAHFAQPGVYTCVLTSANGCTETFSFTVPGAPFFNVNATAPLAASCNDSVPLSVLVNGVLDANYTYLWNTNPPFTGNTPGEFPLGTYVVQVTDTNGCILSDTVDVINGHEISLMASSWDAGCDTIIAGSAYAYTASGTPPYAFSWSTSPVQTQQGIYGLSPGTYSVTVTDAGGCSATDTVMIGGFGNSSTTLSVVPTGCGPGTFSAAAYTSGGSPPYTYSWNTVPVQTNDTAINLSPGTYICTVIDSNGCSSVNSITIANTLFQVLLSPSQTAVCGDTVTLIAQCLVPGTSYAWQPGNLSGSSIQVVAGSTTTYTLTATNSCGTWSGTTTVTVSSTPLQQQNICGVSVDTALNKNRIFWYIDPAFTSGYFSVFKEQPQNSGNYVLAATQPVTASGQYVDQSSAPGVSSDCYQISYTDTCLSSSPMSVASRTIFLTVTNVSATSWDLDWNAYSGVGNPIVYRVYRGPNPGQLTLFAVVSGITVHYSDVTAPTGTLYYMVEAELPVSCDTAQTVNGNGFASYSNVVCTNPVSVNSGDAGVQVVNLFPNPNNGQMTVQCAVKPGESCTFEITDLSGQVVFTSALQPGYNHEFYVQHLASGLYLAVVKMDGVTLSAHKLVIEN